MGDTECKENVYRAGGGRVPSSLYIRVRVSASDAEIWSTWCNEKCVFEYIYISTTREYASTRIYIYVYIYNLRYCKFMVTRFL